MSQYVSPPGLTACRVFLQPVDATGKAADAGAITAALADTALANKVTITPDPLNGGAFSVARIDKSVSQCDVTVSAAGLLAKDAFSKTYTFVFTPAAVTPPAVDFADKALAVWS